MVNLNLKEFENFDDLFLIALNNYMIIKGLFVTFHLLGDGPIS